MASIKKFVDEGFENLEKGIKQQVTTTVKAVGGQAGVSQKGQSQQAQASPSGGGTDESASNAASQAGAADPSDQQDVVATKQVVDAYYAPSNPNEPHGLSPVDATQQPSDPHAPKPSKTFIEKVEKGMSPEDAAKYESLRQKLHDETYYIPLTQRKPADEEQKEEEKVEKEEKMEELQVEDKKKKQDDDIALKQAQQKTEKFPGASG